MGRKQVIDTKKSKKEDNKLQLECVARRFYFSPLVDQSTRATPHLLQWEDIRHRPI